MPPDESCTEQGLGVRLARVWRTGESCTKSIPKPKRTKDKARLGALKTHTSPKQLSHTQSHRRLRITKLQRLQTTSSTTPPPSMAFATASKSPDNRSRTVASVPSCRPMALRKLPQKCRCAMARATATPQRILSSMVLCTLAGMPRRRKS